MEEYRIGTEDFTRLRKTRSGATVGRVLKRIETIKDIDILKQCVKEVIHEEFRNLEENVGAFTSGTLFNLRNKKAN